MPSSDGARAAVAQLLVRFGQPAVELTASGTSAIDVALELLHIGHGDEVIVPDLGCHMIAAAVVRAHAVPVFVGVGESLTLTLDDVAGAVSARTRAVIAVHQYGLPCDVPGIVGVVPSTVTVIEDVAQTWGSHTRGRACGSVGALAVTSFGPGKPVCLGAGGALFGPAASVAGAVSHGESGEGQLPRPPSAARFPMPLIELLPAAIDQADASLIARRSAVAALVDSDLSATFRLPLIAPDSSAAWTTVPLYPTQRVSGAQLRLVRERLGAIGLIPKVPPSGLPMFANYDKRIVPGSRGADPLLVSPRADGRRDGECVPDAG
jgi:dTDP-4-amino-4,6-dideoxygalactose transaminase